MIPHRMAIRRPAFSLLEVIIATAILAASGMVLTSLLGLGTKYGNRAEERTLAQSQALSLLDEVLALPQVDRNPEDEVTGELPGTPSHSYRIRFIPFGSHRSQNVDSLPNSAIATSGTRIDSNRTVAQPQLGKLTLVSVEIFESGNPSSSTSRGANGQNTEPLIQLNRLIRSHRLVASPLQQDLPLQRNLPSLGGSL